MRRIKSGLKNVGIVVPTMFWLIYSAGLVFAGGIKVESGAALREISQFQWISDAFEKAGLSDDKTSSVFQGLARVWSKWSGKSLRTSLEAEISGLYGSEKIDRNVSGGWESSGKSETFKRWVWTASPLNRDHTEILGSIERLDFAWSMGCWDIDLGRQPVSLGTSHFVGILDVIAPFHPGYLDASYKPGVDALRVRTGMGTSGEVEIISVAARNPSKNALIGRVRRTLSGIDVEILGGRFRDRNFTGFAWEGENKKITWWGEVGFFQRIPEMENRWGGDRRFALSWIFGLEKELKPKLRGGIGFLYQDFGIRNIRDLSLVGNDAPYQEGWMFLGASRYGVVTLRKELNPLTNADLNVIVNVIDGSTLWQPKVVFSTGDNSDLAVFTWISSGKEPVNIGPVLIPESEFGAFPDGIGFIIRRFF